MHRRDFLLASAGTLGSLMASPRWLAAMPRRDGSALDDRRLVVIRLDGGNDGLNTVVPFEDDAYGRVRPALGLARNTLLPLDDLNGFHPALEHTAARFADGGLCILRGVGYPQPNLSHFRSKDIWDTASLAQPMPETGWLGRLVDARLQGSADPTAMIAVGKITTPLSMRAERHVAYAIQNAKEFVVRAGPRGSSADELEARARALAVLNSGSTEPRMAGVAEAVTAANASIKAIERALERTARADYEDNGLARSLNIIARAIDAELPTRCFFVAQGGYDTHANQAGTQAGLLKTLDVALHSFLNDLQALGKLDRTLILIITEFGRRVAESGVGATAGTDHGAASMVMLLGGGIRPGLHGGQPQLDTLDENGNTIHDVDFRSVYADVIEGWFGIEAKSVLGAEYARAGVVRS
jgi:uncharacterized protein (DUF1501 family)